jgi:hypothetical protein
MIHAMFLAYMPTGGALGKERDHPGSPYGTNRAEGSHLGGPFSSTQPSVTACMLFYRTSVFFLSSVAGIVLAASAAGV